MLLAYGAMLAALVQQAKMHDADFAAFANKLFDSELGKQRSTTGKPSKVDQEAREIFMDLLSKR
jgi:hypothetical protein